MSVTFSGIHYNQMKYGSVSDYMAALLYESVAVLVRSWMVEDLKPRVAFDWTSIGKPNAPANTVGVPTGNCPLLRLPSRIEFEVVIRPGSSWFTKDAVERWLDAYCPEADMRVRVGLSEWV